jgi:uncharacterized protein
MGQPVAWFEVTSHDAERSHKFYAELFGWEVDRAEALGGRRLVPPTELPGDFGKFAVFADPDGIPVGLWA